MILEKKELDGITWGGKKEDHVNEGLVYVKAALWMGEEKKTSYPTMEVVGYSLQKLALYFMIYKIAT